jgi:hypothetical protein
MEEIINKLLHQYFSDYKEYHLIILTVVLVIIALIQIIQSFVISKKLEKFKTELKKSEIKFSRHSELQIIALREIYHRLVTFQRASNLLFISNSKKIGHNSYKNRIVGWRKAYSDCATEFSREKILLSDDLKLAFGDTLKDFDEVNDILFSQKESLEYWETAHYGDWNAMYQFEENELDSISQQLESIKEKNSINSSQQHIRELRKKIEEEFNKMTK